METKDKKANAESFKDLGNTAVKNGNFREAVLQYTSAIKLTPNDCILYSNRSLAYLKLEHYSAAYEDANSTIKLNPHWPKGYFRKGQVEFATDRYREAISSYEEALSYKPDDYELQLAVKKCYDQIYKTRKDDERSSWLGAGIGLILGVVINVADAILAPKPTNPILMCLITVAISMIGYVIARVYQYFRKQEKLDLLQGPEKETDAESEVNSKNNGKSHSRYTKSQARQRYKQGKVT